MNDEEPIDEVVSFATMDEAIAVAMEQVGEGGIVSIHAEDCEIDEATGEDCSCEPLVLQVGAKA